MYKLITVSKFDCYRMFINYNWMDLAMKRNVFSLLIACGLILGSTSTYASYTTIGVPQKGTWTDWKYVGAKLRFIGGVDCYYEREFYAAIGNDHRKERKTVSLPKGMHCPKVFPN